MFREKIHMVLKKDPLVLFIFAKIKEKSIPGFEPTNSCSSTTVTHALTIRPNGRMKLVSHLHLEFIEIFQFAGLKKLILQSAFSTK